MRRTRALRLTTTAGVALTALTALTACSGSTAKTASDAASKGVSGAKSAVVSVADALSLTTKKTSSFSAAKMNMTMVIPKVGTSTMNGTVSYKPVALDATMTNPQLPGTMRLLMSGTTEYVNMGATGAKEFGGKHWLKIDFSELGAGGKALADSINRSGSQDPSTSVKLLTSSGDIRRVGTETVDGVSTTHYSGTVDVKKLVSSDPGLKAIADQAAKSGMTTETVDMWVNDQSLPVKVHETATTSQGTMDITIHYSDFSNTPVTITAPPASDTEDLASLSK
ncbi:MULTISPECIES: hypothetical protein [Streptacidiphilus]|uniref:LppX_LprAFG lipoprotein n=2 Tax=Streptacidiphilus TaxID=228398 RepID=A0ABV6UGC8_9ACTN|nr:hypothetical protein [Streptacidiphilus jeojiense]